MYRLAKYSDLKDITTIRYSIREKNPLGIFAKMGKPFIKEYYRIVINDPTTLFICYENDNQKIEGFVFAVLNSKRFQVSIKRNKVRLACASLSSFLLKPSLFKELFKRFKSVEKQTDDFVHMSGARIGYWGWDPHMPNPEMSVGMHEVLLRMTKLLGYEKIYLEVDKENKSIYKFHKINGAIVEEEKKLCDNRTRALMYYDLNNK
jgi:hypothetical protein